MNGNFQRLDGDSRRWMLEKRPLMLCMNGAAASWRLLTSGADRPKGNGGRWCLLHQVRPYLMAHARQRRIESGWDSGEGNRSPQCSASGVVSSWKCEGSCWYRKPGFRFPQPRILRGSRSTSTRRASSSSSAGWVMCTYFFLTQLDAGRCPNASCGAERWIILAPWSQNRALMFRFGKKTASC